MSGADHEHPEHEGHGTPSLAIDGVPPSTDAEAPHEARPAGASSSEGQEVHPADRRLPRLPPEERPGREPGVAWTVGALVRAWRSEGVGWFVRRAPGWVRPAIIAVVLFGLSFAGYALLSWNRFGQPSQDTHFVYLAHSFKQGTVEMLVPPPHGNDWASWVEVPVKGGETLRGIWIDRSIGKFRELDGSIYILKNQDLDYQSRNISCDPSNARWRSVVHLCQRRRQHTHHFVSFPPGPAVLMMPFVPATDADEVDLKDPQKLGLNDVQFTIFFAALNVVLLFFLLQRLSRFGVSTRTWRENLLLTLLFAFGSNVVWCSIVGQVWFTALVIGITFTLLYVMASIDTRHPFLAGLFLACGMATRTPLAFSALFFAYFLFFPDGRLRRTGWGEVLRKGALFAAPIIAVGGALMWMNLVRYDNAFEFGHSYLAQGQLYRIQKYGLFNYHFLSKNLLAAFALLPRFQPYSPYILVSKHGMSLFMTTPALLYLLAYRSGPRLLDRKWHWGLWLATASIAVPGFFYQNTGWAQYGFRFSLDYMVYLTLLLALNRRRIGVFFVILVVLGVAVSVFGAVTFGRMQMFYEDWMIDPDR